MHVMGRFFFRFGLIGIDGTYVVRMCVRKELCLKGVIRSKIGSPSFDWRKAKEHFMSTLHGLDDFFLTECQNLQWLIMMDRRPVISQWLR